MNFKIIWSDFSEIQLDEIFEFYVKETSVQVFKKNCYG